LNGWQMHRKYKQNMYKKKKGGVTFQSGKKNHSLSQIFRSVSHYYRVWQNPKWPFCLKKGSKIFPGVLAPGFGGTPQIQSIILEEKKTSHSPPP
jgi:hypothetical protein